MAAKVLQRLDILLFANTAQYRSEMRDTQQSTTTIMGAIKADATAMAKVGAKAFAGMAAASTIAIGAMIKEQVELGTEMTRLSRIANTSVEDMQKLTYAAKAMGVEQDTLGDIYKDTQDKIGDFLSSGGGAMADYFENVAPVIGQTAEEFRTLSGPEALQKYYDGLQQANLSQSEMIFYLEGIASDASALIPLLHDNGAGFDVWATAAENAGAVMSAKTITATQELQASTDLLMLSYDGAKKQFTQALIPVLSDVAGQLVGSGNAADFARESGDKLVQTIKLLAKAGTVVATVFKTVGTVIGGAAATVTTLLDGVSITDGAMITALKIARNGSTAANVIRDLSFDTRQIWADASTNFARIDALGTGPTNKFVSTVMAQNMAQQQLNRTLGITGQQYQAQLAAAEASEKAAKKSAAAAAKSIQAQAVNSKVLAQAKQFNYDNLEKEYGLPAGLLSAVSMQESRGNANARSPVGASGAFQFMPGTADRFGIRGQESNVGKSAEAAAKYLSFLMNKFGSVDLALAGYNAGEGNVTKYGNKIPPFKETQEYVKKVNSYLAFMKGGLDGSVNIAGNIAAQTAVIEREAAEQVRILEQQAKDRVAIRLEYSDEATRIEEQLKTKILQISASGFSDNERDAFIADAIDVANEKLAQIQLVHDREMQYAQQAEQTDAERIRNQYALERREIQLTINMDEQLRKAKIDALNQAEQLALDERRYAYERALRDLTNIGQSDLAALRQSYADQRRVLDARTDIDDGQKSGLSNAMAGAQIYDTNQLQKPARDAFESQQAQLGGYSQQYGLNQQYKQQLEVIENAKKAELLTVETYEQAKFAAQQDYQQQTQQMMLGGAQEQFGSVTELMRMAFGEQNALYQGAFIFQKGLAIAQALLNIPESYSQAFNAVVGIPIVGPVLAPAAGIAAAGIQVAQKALIEKVQPPSMPGFEVGGYTGAGGTSDVAGLVHKEEFVANAPTTKRFRPELEAMHDGSYDKKYRNQGVNINITNNAPVDITTSVNDDGSIEMRIDKRINERVPQIMAQQINTPASPVRNALTNNFNLERRF